MRALECPIAFCHSTPSYRQANEPPPDRRVAYALIHLVGNQLLLFADNLLDKSACSEVAMKKTIGLCMTVKNDSEVVLRCLESVRPIVDYVLVEDTGSTDGTQSIIREWLDRAGLPGEVYDEPWHDFAYNWSHALARLREKKDVDYALIIKAGDVL